MPDIAVKICGLTRPTDVTACVDAGVRYCGFNFFPRSPRSVGFDDAKALAGQVPVGMAKVALLVDPDDETLTRLTDTVPLDFIQLHGHEPPERVAEVRSRFGLPVIKVLGVATAADLAPVEAMSRVADMLLIDAKPLPDADLPGGNGLTFDWRLLEGRRWSVPWMLAGGLTPANVAEAIARTGAKQVDVASGVESAPGVKDADLIADFVRAARGN